MKPFNGEIYLKKPTPFIQANYQQLLPDWTILPRTMIIIILFSEQLINPNLVEAEKQRLKEDFLQLGYQLRGKAMEQNYLMEIINPQDGYPVYSKKGSISFDIVAIIHQVLGFKISQNNGCTVLHHPSQNTAIYPCLLLSDADVKEISRLTHFINTNLLLSLDNS